MFFGNKMSYTQKKLCTFATHKDKPSLYKDNMTKKAIVMGATSGIGMEVAKLLAAKGWQVGIAGRRTERLQTLMTDGIACYQQIDVTSADAPTQLQQLIDKLGGMDLYFHSSGIGWQNNQLDIEKELKTVETNGMGFTRMVDTAFNWFAAHAREKREGNTTIALPASPPSLEQKDLVLPQPTLPPNDSKPLLGMPCPASTYAPASHLDNRHTADLWQPT